MTDLRSHLSSEEQLAFPYEDQLAYITKTRTIAEEHIAASEVRKYVMIALRDQARVIKQSQKERKPKRTTLFRRLLTDIGGYWNIYAASRTIKIAQQNGA